MNKRIYLILILGMFLFSLVPMTSAEDKIGTFKSGDEFNITNYCFSADCTYMNLSSITYPNGTVDFLNVAMNKIEQEFTYNFSSEDLGTYYFRTCADPKGSQKCERDFFIINPTGSEFTTAQGLIFLGSLIILIIIAGMFCFLGIKAEKGIVQVSLVSFSLLILIFSLGFTLNMINNLAKISEVLSGNYGAMYILFTILLSAGIAALVLYLIYISLTAFWEVRGKR